ncbi:hypothetical protein BV898_00923 [Hypsibius exemplaris]|uniref:Nuclear nucleic acid-binding protein C1D n=1 Tax=Hypsibius exemplaris TaxID=2072580 RepID=A0A1W0XCK9_HYPEX|nr:hypothetical protein BV898_00923 [Hypsibius exemplaris]
MPPTKRVKGATAPSTSTQNAEEKSDPVTTIASTTTLTESTNTKCAPDSQRELKLGKVLDSAVDAGDDGCSDDSDDSDEAKISRKAQQLTLDFTSSELPKEVGDTLDSLLVKITDLQQLVNRWIAMTPADRAACFVDSLEEERMSLWIMNALVSLGEVYCRLQGMDPEKEGCEKRKTLLARYAFKFDELEPSSPLLSKVDGGPKTRLDMPAVKRFLKSALVDDSDAEMIEAPK